MRLFVYAFFGFLALSVGLPEGYSFKTKKEKKSDSVVLAQVVSKLQSMEQDIQALRTLLKEEGKTTEQTVESLNPLENMPEMSAHLAHSSSFLGTLHTFFIRMIALVYKKIHLTFEDMYRFWRMGVDFFRSFRFYVSSCDYVAWSHLMTGVVSVFFYGLVLHVSARSLAMQEGISRLFFFLQKKKIHFLILFSFVLFLFFIVFNLIDPIVGFSNHSFDWIWRGVLFFLSGRFLIQILSRLLFTSHKRTIALVPFEKRMIQRMGFWFYMMVGSFSFWMALHPLHTLVPPQTFLDLWLLGIAFSLHHILKILATSYRETGFRTLGIHPFFFVFLIWLSHAFFFLLWLNSARDIHLLFFFFTYLFFFPLGSYVAHQLRFYRLQILKRADRFKPFILSTSLLSLLKYHRFFNQSLFYVIQFFLLFFSTYLWDFHRFLLSFFRFDLLGFHPLITLRSFLFGKCLDLGIVFGGAYGLTYLASKMIPLFFNKGFYAHSTEQSHVIRRLKILSSIFQGIAKILIWIPAFGMGMTILGYEMRPLLASLGFLSVGLAFGLQTFIRDFITGFFIIFENSLMIGDEVDIDGHCGKVEDLSLRIVRIRKEDGSLFTFPLSSIIRIGNKNRFFSYAIFTVSVDIKENVDRIKGLMESAAMRLRRSEIAPLLLAPLEYQGLINVTDYSLVIQGRLRTAPGQQDKVHRAYTRMLKLVFDEVGIRIPTPPSSASWKAPSLTKTSLNGQ